MLQQAEATHARAYELSRHVQGIPGSRLAFEQCHQQLGLGPHDLSLHGIAAAVRSAQSQWWDGDWIERRHVTFRSYPVWRGNALATANGWISVPLGRQHLA